MVHAYVGLKLLKSNKNKSFLSDQLWDPNTAFKNANAIPKPPFHMLFSYYYPTNKLYAYLS